MRRTQPWFGNFMLSSKFFLKEASCLRTLNHTHIDHVLDIRKEWGKRVNKNWGGSWQSPFWVSSEITDLDRGNLHKVCDFFLATSISYKLTLSGDELHLYSNDEKIFHDLIGLGILDVSKGISISTVDLVGSPGSVVIKSPQHSKRTYLRNKSLDARTIENLKKFLESQESVRIGPGFAQWLNAKGRYPSSRDYYFIDHDDDSILTMLNMISSGITRKTVPITADK